MNVFAEFDPPTIDDLIALPEAAEPQLSPDSQSVAYSVITPDWEADVFRSQLWLVPTAGGPARQLTFARSDSITPRWSPDSNSLAFLSKRAGDQCVQIYRLRLDGGDAQRLTEAEGNVLGLAWAPDGRRLAFRALDAPSPEESARQDRFGPVHRENVDYRWAHLWLLDLETRNVQRLTGGDDFHVVSLAWSPDGRWLAFEARPTPDANDQHSGKIYRLDLAAGQSKTPQALTGPGYANPHWSPAGRALAVERHGPRPNISNNQICLLPAAGGPERLLTAGFDEKVALCGWGPDGLYFLAAQPASRHLFRLDPERGACTRCTPDTPGFTALNASLHPHTSLAALLAADSDHYQEIGLLSLAERPAPSGQPQPVRWLTHFTQQTAGWRLAQPETMHWTSADGTPVQGVLLKPPDFDPSQPRPLLVALHGGPVDARRPTPLQPSERRTYPIQQWVQQGALVLYPNYRGSAGYGEAFRRLPVGNLGPGEAEDVLSGVQNLVERGWVDPERLGVLGWSQGGFITAYLTITSDRFQAGSVGAGISSWAGYYTNSDLHSFPIRYLDATPWDDPESYARSSPISYIHQARTPILIQHGDQDPRVPPLNAYTLYQGLRDMGVETELVLYKGMGHSLDRPRFCRHSMQVNLDWFERWLWPAAEPPSGLARPLYLAPAAGPEPDAQPWVQAARAAAQRDGAEFRLIAARDGLLPAGSRPQPPAARLTLAGLSALSQQLAAQLRRHSAGELVLFVPDPETQPWGRLYFAALQAAAGELGQRQVIWRPVWDA